MMALVKSNKRKEVVQNCAVHVGSASRLPGRCKMMLKEHVERSIYFSIAPNPYKCRECGDVFRTSVGKNKHLVKHAENKDRNKESYGDYEIYRQSIFHQGKLL